MDADAAVDELRALGIEPGDLVALVVGDASLSVAVPTWATNWPVAPADVVGRIDRELGPRWVLWSQATAGALAGHGVRLTRSWDAAAVHRLLFGGWRADPGRIWARLHDLPTADLPAPDPIDLFHQTDDGDPAGPLREDGYLDPEWIDGGWASSPDRMAAWAGVLADVARLQLAAVGDVSARDERPMALRTAYAESTAELLCAELTVGGLPMDRAAMEGRISAYVGPRPRSPQEAVELRDARDEEVLRHVPEGVRFDLRSPSQVRSMLRMVGVEVPDTRAWRLERLRDAHPLVDALLAWRKAERVQTTFGYGWLDENLGPDGRFRGEWSGSDGAAGRMTASAGLHNMPADLRGGVVAEPGHVFVRADLGQIEPRVLAAVSGDRALAAASQADDLYAPVAAELGVDRAIAKVAVLGAMYGQTTGEGGRALAGLRRSYPVAMAYLDAADRAAQVGHDLRTYGGRLVRTGSAALGEPGGPDSIGDREARSQAAARGRYGRNAMVQGAAAELFKVWAVTVRARGRDLDAQVVLCLHDELLVHVPDEHAGAAAAMVDDALQEAAARWAPDRSVRFLSDTAVIPTWADAKG
ncbi:DNA polymerase [Dermatobacter hominis]|uniref:DNA polymerase n=1 Tax=Dermatobacter hominis TaxID=2884263 RepID=UPI001D0F6A8F|nr:DNA polymerase [Dermatobacter hominis]UDY35865.1 DNA polymerase [Dermatobacter hominis]